MKLSNDQRVTIVDNDTAAQERLRALYAKVKLGEISTERAARLRSNIEGQAIERWKARCLKHGVAAEESVSDLLLELEVSYT